MLIAAPGRPHAAMSMATLLATVSARSHRTGSTLDRHPHPVVPVPPMIRTGVPHHVKPGRPRRRWRPRRRRTPAGRVVVVFPVVAVIPVPVVAPTGVPLLARAPVIRRCGSRRRLRDPRGQPEGRHGNTTGRQHARTDAQPGPFSHSCIDGQTISTAETLVNASRSPCGQPRCSRCTELLVGGDHHSERSCGHVADERRKPRQ
jgi:hypothetical protein